MPWRHLSFHSKDDPRMHRDLPRIKRAHSHGAVGAAGTQAGYQSCASIIYQVRTAETADETGVIGTVELRVVQQIGGLRGNLQLEALGDGKSSPESEVDVEAAGPANIAACLGSVAIPVLIWDNASVRSRQSLSGESAGVVFKVAVLLWSDGFSAG